MRLLVRSGVNIILLLGFSRIVTNAPDISQSEMLFLTYKPQLWIIQFQGDSQLKRKDNSSRSPCRRLRARFEVLPQLSAFYLRNINLIPFRLCTRKSTCITRNFPMSQERVTHDQMLFSWNPSPLRPSKFSFEYLLLPPRSALNTVPTRLTPKSSVQYSRPLTHHSFYLL